MEILEHILLAPLTTLRVGGAARYFAEATSPEQVCEGVGFAQSRNLPMFVLGGGSNLVVSDTGFPGLVLKNAIRGIEEHLEDGKGIFAVGAGEDWDEFVARSVTQNYAGIECLSGIPGTVGATPVQNVGAYGQEVASTIVSVEALDLRDGQIRKLCNNNCGFQYRSSIFNSTEKGRYIILAVTFALRPGGAPYIEYADLKKYFADHDGLPTVSATREAVRKIRRSKAMLIVEGDEDCRSVGSFFKNPILTAEQYEALLRRAAAMNMTFRSYPGDAGYKVPAAWLIEQSGFNRGFTKGLVGISSKHALAIVNHGGATAAEVVGLKDDIQQAVADRFGITLQPEPVFIGF